MVGRRKMLLVFILGLSVRAHEVQSPPPAAYLALGSNHERIVRYVEKGTPVSHPGSSEHWPWQ